VAQGAALKLYGGNIEIHGPGTMAFKASMKELAGPSSSSSELSFPTSAVKGCEQSTRDASAAQAGSQTL
jgi:type VI secretion system secreted protein VgrG